MAHPDKVGEALSILKDLEEIAEHKDMNISRTLNNASSVIDSVYQSGMYITGNEYSKYCDAIYRIGLMGSYCFAPSLILPLLCVFASLNLCNNFYLAYSTRNDFDPEGYDALSVIRNKMPYRSWVLACLVNSAITLLKYSVDLWFFTGTTTPLALYYAGDLPSLLVQCFGENKLSRTNDKASDAINSEEEQYGSFSTEPWVAMTMALRNISMLAVYFFVPEAWGAAFWASLSLSLLIHMKSANDVGYFEERILNALVGMVLGIVEIIILPYVLCNRLAFMCSFISSGLAPIPMSWLFGRAIDKLDQNLDVIVGSMPVILQEIGGANKTPALPTDGLTFEERLVNEGYSHEMVAID